MSDATAGLRRKLDGAADLQSVVRTMKALAAANISQYEQSTRALAIYLQVVELGLHACFRQDGPAILEPRSNAPSATAVMNVVVFGSDQGLVGRFNEIVVEHALQGLANRPGKVVVWAVGERVHAQLTDTALLPAGLFNVPGSVSAIASLVGRILVKCEADRNAGDRSELVLFYNRTATGTSIEPVNERLLPLDEKWRRRLAAQSWPTRYSPQVLGTLTASLRALIREYLFISLFRACAESLASENASRLAAMERADQNIDEMLEQLRGAIRRVRQGSIDEELFDVISGFEALSSGERHLARQIHPRTHSRCGPTIPVCVSVQTRASSTFNLHRQETRTPMNQHHQSATAAEFPVSVENAQSPPHTVEAIREALSATAALARESRIAVAAYYQAEKRGYVPGGEMEDWLAAERDLG